MDVQRTLRKFRFYRDATEPFRKAVAAAVQSVHLDQGTHFYQMGQRCPRFAMVGSGEIRVYRLGRTGREITLYHVRAGETCVVDTLCGYLDAPAPASAVAETPVTALVVPAGQLRQWILEQEVVRTYVFESIAYRVVDLMTLVEEVAFQKMDQRLAGHLRNQFQHARSGASSIATTHERIAGELGSAREVISRLLEEFQRQGAIHLGRGRIVLRDDELLQRIERSEGPVA